MTDRLTEEELTKMSLIDEIRASWRERDEYIKMYRSEAKAYKELRIECDTLKADLRVLRGIDSTDCKGLPCNSADPDSPLYCDACVARLKALLLRVSDSLSALDYGVSSRPYSIRETYEALSDQIDTDLRDARIAMGVEGDDDLPEVRREAQEMTRLRAERDRLRGLVRQAAPIVKSAHEENDCNGEGLYGDGGNDDCPGCVDHMAAKQWLAAAEEVTK